MSNDFSPKFGTLEGLLRGPRKIWEIPEIAGMKCKVWKVSHINLAASSLSHNALLGGRGHLLPRIL